MLTAMVTRRLRLFASETSASFFEVQAASQGAGTGAVVDTAGVGLAG